MEVIWNRHTTVLVEGEAEAEAVAAAAVVADATTGKRSTQLFEEEEFTQEIANV